MAFLFHESEIFRGYLVHRFENDSGMSVPPIIGRILFFSVESGKPFRGDMTPADAAWTDDP